MLRRKLAPFLAFVGYLSLACTGLGGGSLRVEPGPQASCGDVADDWIAGVPGPLRREQAARAMVTQSHAAVPRLLGPLGHSHLIDRELWASALRSASDPELLAELREVAPADLGRAEQAWLDALTEAVAHEPATHVSWSEGTLDVVQLSPVPVVRATVAGQPVRLLLDTASPTTVLGTHLELPGARYGSLSRGNPLLRADLDLGVVKVEHVVAVESDLSPEIRAIADGRLGWSELQHLRLRLVQAEGSLYVERPVPRGHSDLAQPLEPTVRLCGPDNQALDLALATGQAQSVVHPAGVSLLSGASEPERVSGARTVPQARLGLHDAVLVYPDLTVVDDPTDGTFHTRHGVLGWDAFLAAGEAVIDGPGGVVRLEPTARR